MEYVVKLTFPQVDRGVTINNRTFLDKIEAYINV